MKRTTQCLLVLVLLFSGASSVKASGVTYTETGYATGTLDGTAFTDALVTITLTGDTSNVILLSPTNGLYFNGVGTSTVVVAGVGTDTFTSPTFGAFAEQSYEGYSSAGFTDYSIGNVLSTEDPAFATYDLTTSISVTDEDIFVYPADTFSTVGGYLDITGVEGDTTFTATVVPEPSAMLLLGSGLLGLAGLWRKFKR